MRNVKGLEIFFIGLGGEFYVGNGLDVLFELAVSGVPAGKAGPRHVFRDVEPGAVIPPSVPVAPHQRVDQKPVGGPREVFRVFADRLEDQRHLIVLVAVAHGLVAVGVRLGVCDGDAVGRRMKFPAPLHVGPHAADKIGGGAVAQHIVFRPGKLGERIGENVHQRFGKGDGLRRGGLHQSGELVRRGEVMGGQKGVHHGINALEIVFGALLGEGFRLRVRQRLQLFVGLTHLLKLVAFQEPRRGLFPQGL